MLLMCCNNVQGLLKRFDYCWHGKKDLTIDFMNVFSWQQASILIFTSRIMAICFGRDFFFFSQHSAKFSTDASFSAFGVLCLIRFPLACPQSKPFSS